MDVVEFEVSGQACERCWWHRPGLRHGRVRNPDASWFLGIPTLVCWLVGWLIKSSVFIIQLLVLGIIIPREVGWMDLTAAFSDVEVTLRFCWSWPPCYHVLLSGTGLPMTDTRPQLGARAKVISFTDGFAASLSLESFQQFQEESVAWFVCVVSVQWFHLFQEKMREIKRQQALGMGFAGKVLALAKTCRINSHTRSHPSINII